jgi:hypothetical protein
VDDLRSIPGVCDVAFVRGARARAGALPDALLEVAHGATRAADFDALAATLAGPFPADLRAFFFVNTDVGAPEVARRTAELFVAAEPERTALVVRCLIPRTFVDCNRRIDADTAPAASAAGAITPGLPPWVREPADVDLLRARYGAYRTLLTRCYERVCGAGGPALMVHSYAPRSIDVPVDERIVERLRAEYEAAALERWPLRAEIDFIADDPDGRPLASETLVTRARAALAGAGLDVARSQAYSLHPSTLAHEFASRFPGRTLCLEVRRDLLVRAFTPFAEMAADAAKVERVAAPLAHALRGGSADGSGTPPL